MDEPLIGWLKSNAPDCGDNSCLFGVRGSLKLQTSEGLPTAYLWPRIGTHSVKPDAFYDLVEKASPGPYLELFARRARLGDWHYWGNQSLNTAEVAA